MGLKSIKDVSVTSLDLFRDLSNDVPLSLRSLANLERVMLTVSRKLGAIFLSRNVDPEPRFLDFAQHPLPRSITLVFEIWYYWSNLWVYFLSTILSSVSSDVVEAVEIHLSVETGLGGFPNFNWTAVGEALSSPNSAKLRRFSIFC